MELKHGFFINGEYVAPKGRETFPVINPATGEKLCDSLIATEADVNDAVTSAKRAFKAWAKKTGAERGRILRKAADILRERNDELAHLEVLNTGKPISEAISVDILSGADCLEYFASLAHSIQGENISMPSAMIYTRPEPLGVCASIGAWNYPIQIACWKAAPALAAGNTVVFKPSELTPLTALVLGEIFADAGLPPGVFNVVTGTGSTGSALVSHPDVAKVSLTGSVPTGKAVMAAAAKSLKHATMELGGKSPLIIFADSDLENAANAAILGNFYTQGEICSNCTRVFVEKSVLPQFLERLLAKVKMLSIGSPLLPSTQIGALISKAHMEKVLGYIEIGKKEGATLVTGGKRYAQKGCEKGFFVEPTIFTNCTDEMTIVREEIFGPVMSILSFTREDEVIERANNTEFGLAAGVFTKDLTRGHRVIGELQAGTCWINNYNITPVEMPFGGYKHSGMGRENGLAALRHYTQIKSVYVELGDVQAEY